MGYSSSNGTSGGSRDGSFEQGIGTYSHSTLKLPKKEYGKVMHEINTVYHARFEGKTQASISIRNNTYFFEIKGYDQYNLYYKEEIE